MKTDQIFIGNIKKCTKYDYRSQGYGDWNTSPAVDSKLYKQNAVLIKVENGGYVDLEKLNSLLDYIKIYKDITENGYRLGGLMRSIRPHCVDCLFVDLDSLKPYYSDKQKKEKTSVHQLRKQIRSNNR